VGRYLALFALGFRRQSTYRAALITGLLANVFWGVFRSAVFIALYRQRPTGGGLELQDALTYVWVLQTLFGVIFTPWLWEYPERVRSGDVVVDLLRPGDPLGRLLALDLGRSTFSFLARGLPQLVVPALVLHLRLPTSPIGLAALAVSFLLCAVAAFEMRFLFGSVAFWTPDFRGWWSLLFGVVWLGAGFVVPVQLFPAAFRWFALSGPLSALLTQPVRVATGDGVAGALLIQLGWVVVIGVGCRVLMAQAERHLVVHGG
jgi:ABC-2 type transport system permease protein